MRSSGSQSCGVQEGWIARSYFTTMGLGRWCGDLFGYIDLVFPSFSLRKEDFLDPTMRVSVVPDDCVNSSTGESQLRECRIRQILAKSREWASAFRSAKLHSRTHQRETILSRSCLRCGLILRGMLAVVGSDARLCAEHQRMMDRHTIQSTLKAG